MKRNIGLETCTHLGPSIIYYFTLNHSENLPREFLQGIGISDIFIDYLPSLIGDTIEYYTCFISYTEVENEFSLKLYNDLQAEGIRCWKWKEDAKMGSTLMREIDEAIRTYEKLVVICSENSLQSQPVIREIERALQKEDDLRKHNKNAEVLFPIRLDDSIFSWDHYRQPDIVVKKISDFRYWKNHKKYRKEFKELVKALKKEKTRKEFKSIIN